MFQKSALVAFCIFALFSSSAAAHELLESGASHDLPKLKTGTAAVFDPWKLLELAISPAFAASNQVYIHSDSHYRYIKSNGLPDHQTGSFPNAGNPNRISEQSYSFRVPLIPVLLQTTTPLRMNMLFGVALNGVPFDPGANEYWNGDRFSGWQYEAMYLGPRLGLDENNAHVQPNGAYHYHGLPAGLLKRLAGLNKPVLLGYAADGFPVYGPYAYKNGKDAADGLLKLRPGYSLRKGQRPASAYGPAGSYNGEFVQDYEFVKGSGDLDECNGYFAVTAEYPEGTYQYVLTDQYPFIPRAWRANPDRSFFKTPPAHGAHFGPQAAGHPDHPHSRPGF